VLDVFHAERPDARRYLDGCDTSRANSGDEFAGAETRLSHRLTWSKHAPRYDLSSRDSSASCANHIWLTNVANKRADVTRRHPEPVGFDDRGVADNTRYVVINSGPLILLLCLDEVAPGRICFIRHAWSISA
jgi:hypothetical protein